MYLPKIKSTDIIQAHGEVQFLKRRWYEVWKKGWKKHRDHWDRLWWIRFNSFTKVNRYCSCDNPDPCQGVNWEVYCFECKKLINHEEFRKKKGV